ncbi:MAG TPA: DNA (cytosine-5-)-methyltransferase [Gallionella sp.]|nr:DNA (cytosine-5-)-methyltransferase [Gallionella sp.]
MSNFIQRVEEVLLQGSTQVVSKGSDPIALAHHWAHAIANNTAPIGGIDTDVILAHLKSNGLYTTRAQFKKNLFAEINFPPPSTPRFRFIDLFAGIGGFRLALQNVKGCCVFSSEWDRSAQQTYFNNYGELPFGDIAIFAADNVSDSDVDKFIPDHEVLAGGFPCQPFSHAGVSARNAVGKMHGFKCNTQGTLFFDIMRIASIKKPKVLFLENVRNIERHDGGRTFAVIRESIDELGYDFKHAIINASTLVPQRRLRCYMVCFQKKLGIDYVFPDFTGKPLPLRSILEPDPLPKYTITDRLWQGHINRTQRNLNRGTGFTAFTADLDKPSNTLVARYGKDGKECLIPQLGSNPRLLTPRECARLQGYPEEFLIPEARTPAYKQFGNSVAIPVVSKIAESIIEVLK